MHRTKFLLYLSAENFTGVRSLNFIILLFLKFYKIMCQHLLAKWMILWAHFSRPSPSKLKTLVSSQELFCNELHLFILSSITLQASIIIIILDLQCFLTTNILLLYVATAKPKLKALYYQAKIKPTVPSEESNQCSQIW